MNVRLQDSLTNRLRGGSFTGIAAGARPSEILYRDRVLTFSGRAITATRMGDHTDTTMSADVSDERRPTLFQFAEAGAQGGTVVTLVPHKDQYLLGFTANETWVQQGDPLTGTRRRVSDQVGITGASAWCVAHDTVYFLSARGLYSVGADGSGLKALSEDKLPEHLLGAAGTLTYNHADRGVYIHLSSGVSWFYDTAREQFWPFDTSTTASHLLIGPLHIGGPTQHGLLQTIHGIVAANSGTVTWRVIGETTAEAACDSGKAAITADLASEDFDAYVDASGTWSAGRSYTSYPRVRTPWVVLWLSSTADWAYESVILEVVPQFGRIRL